MGKKVKRKLEWFAAYDRSGIEHYLEDMAAKGWLLDKLNGLSWRYHRIEPSKVHFAVTYFAETSPFELAPVPTTEQRRYWDYCKKAGWLLAAESAPMQVFYNTEENPVPIETDARVQVANIHSAMKKTVVFVFSFLLVIILLNLCMRLWDLYENPAEMLSKNSSLADLLLNGYMMALCVCQLFGYFLWHHRAKRAALLDGSFYEKEGKPWIQKAGIFILILIMLFFSYAMVTSGMVFLGLTAFAMPVMLTTLCFLLKKIIIKMRNGRLVSNIGVVLCMVVFAAGFIFFITIGIDKGWIATEKKEGQPPFLVNDVLATDASKYTSYCDQDKSFMLERIDVENNLKDNGEEVPQLRYTLTKVKKQVVYNLCLNGIFRENARIHEDIPQNIRPNFVLEKDASLWGAEKVYQEYNEERPMGHYVICWKDRIAELQFFWEPTEQQLGTMAERLRQF